MPATPAWPPRSAPRLFVPPTLVEGEIRPIDGNQAHYLARVMRVAANDAVILCDDQTGEWAAEVIEAGKRHVTVRIVQKLRDREQVPDLWLCPALLKKDRFDFVLEKATELGVAKVLPFVAARSVADKLNAGRARAITIEAAEQCARTALPQICEPGKLPALLNDWQKDRALYFADELGGPPASEAFGASPHAAAIIVGPEGGFTDEERELIRRHPQARPISLGPRILRGETAALAATALWMGIAGDWSN